MKLICMTNKMVENSTLTKKEIKVFLGINYIISINKMPTIKSFWECGQFIDNEGIRNVMGRSRFKEISNFQKTQKIEKWQRLQSQIPYLPL